MAGAAGDGAVIDKAFWLLNALHAAAGRGMGVSALARSAGLSKSTAFRLLSMLERNGAVAKLGTEYFLGTTLHRISHPDESAVFDEMRDLLTPYLVDLTAATGGSVHLGALVNDEVLYLTRIHGHAAPLTRVRVGHVAPAHCTATGKVLLAHDPAAVARLCARPLEARTERSVTRVEDLRAELAAIMAAGIAVEHGESMPGLSCAAVALGGIGRQPRLAISVATDQPANLPRYGDMLRRVRLEAERALQLARTAAVRSASTHPAMSHAAVGHPEPGNRRVACSA